MLVTWGIGFHPAYVYPVSDCFPGLFRNMAGVASPPPQGTNSQDIAVILSSLTSSLTSSFVKATKETLREIQASKQKKKRPVVIVSDSEESDFDDAATDTGSESE